MKQIIGKTDFLDSLPVQLSVSKQSYILTRHDGELVLFSAICPHKQGKVRISDQSEECLRCPRHGWKFDAETGESLNVPGEQLDSVPVWIEGETLVAELPDRDNQDQSCKSHSRIPDISLVSHASLLIETEDYSLLTDPWIDGPAFLGSWTQCPPPRHGVQDLNDVDAVWVTHEHSDHMHPNTLQQLDNDIPVYVPELNYKRLAGRLREFGFETVYSLPTDEPYPLNDSISATCFQSESVWNDSILYLDFDGFEILNVNDAGINWSVEASVGTVDLVAAQFSQGASGYPQTWEHLTMEKKQEIMQETNEGLLDMATQIDDLFDPDYYLPFASFFDLHQPEHREYSQNLVMNTLDDIRTEFQSSDTTVIDLLPGEGWGEEGFERLDHRDRWFERSFREKYLEYSFSEKYRVPEVFDLDHDELHRYFSRFSGTPYAADVGDLTLGMNLQGADPIHGVVDFDAGTVEYNPVDSKIKIDNLTLTGEQAVRMDCPGKLVQRIIREDLSWDELHIGYWCNFERSPDEYNLAFWKLLHAPWEAATELPTWEEYDPPEWLAGESIADIVERSPDASAVFEDFGMYCVGCPTGMGEGIAEAARLHGLTAMQFEDLVAGLRATLPQTRGSSD